MMSCSRWVVTHLEGDRGVKAENRSLWLCEMEYCHDGKPMN